LHERVRDGLDAHPADDARDQPRVGVQVRALEEVGERRPLREVSTQLGVVVARQPRDRGSSSSCVRPFFSTFWT
jgi:hypothetical protein